jgi:hypothetical protein
MDTMKNFGASQEGYNVNGNNLNLEQSELEKKLEEYRFNPALAGERQNLLNGEDFEKLIERKNYANLRNLGKINDIRKAIADGELSRN